MQLEPHQPEVDIVTGIGASRWGKCGECWGLLSINKVEYAQLPTALMSFVYDFSARSAEKSYTIEKKVPLYNKSSSWARSTASRRLWTPSLPKMWLVCAFTVLTAIASARAI